MALSTGALARTQSTSSSYMDYLDDALADSRRSIFDAAEAAAIAAERSPCSSSMPAERPPSIPGIGPLLVTPGELVACADDLGHVLLTWYYDERTISRVSDPSDPLMSLSFEIAECAEFAGARERVHDCPCRSPQARQKSNPEMTRPRRRSSNSELELQTFQVEGCEPGLVYTFSVRARGTLGSSDSVRCAITIYSGHSEPISMSALRRRYDCAASSSSSSCLPKRPTDAKTSHARASSNNFPTSSSRGTYFGLYPDAYKMSSASRGACTPTSSGACTPTARSNRDFVDQQASQEPGMTIAPPQPLGGSLSAAAAAATTKRAEMVGHRLFDLFTRCDQDMDGLVSRKEILRILRRNVEWNLVGLDDEEGLHDCLERLFHRIDRESDCMVSWDEVQACFSDSETPFREGDQDCGALSSQCGVSFGNSVTEEQNEEEADDWAAVVAAAEAANLKKCKASSATGQTPHVLAHERSLPVHFMAHGGQAARGEPSPRAAPRVVQTSSPSQQRSSKDRDCPPQLAAAYSSYTSSLAEKERVFRQDANLWEAETEKRSKPVTLEKQQLNEEEKGALSSSTSSTTATTAPRQFEEAEEYTAHESNGLDGCTTATTAPRQFEEAEEYRAHEGNGLDGGTTATTAPRQFEEAEEYRPHESNGLEGAWPLEWQLSFQNGLDSMKATGSSLCLPPAVSAGESREDSLCPADFPIGGTEASLTADEGVGVAMAGLGDPVAEADAVPFASPPRTPVSGLKDQVSSIDSCVSVLDCGLAAQFEKSPSQGSSPAVSSRGGGIPVSSSPPAVGGDSQLQDFGNGAPRCSQTETEAPHPAHVELPCDRTDEFQRARHASAQIRVAGLEDQAVRAIISLRKVAAGGNAAEPGQKKRKEGRIRDISSSVLGNSARGSQTSKRSSSVSSTRSATPRLAQSACSASSRRGSDAQMMPRPTSPVTTGRSTSPLASKSCVYRRLTPVPMFSENTGDKERTQAEERRHSDESWRHQKAVGRRRIASKVREAAPSADAEGVIVLGYEAESTDVEPTEAEVTEFAELIGVNPNKEPHLMWIAREGVVAPVLPPWKVCQRGRELFYWNSESKESSWVHPKDEDYTALVARCREDWIATSIPTTPAIPQGQGQQSMPGVAGAASNTAPFAIPSAHCLSSPSCSTPASVIMSMTVTCINYPRLVENERLRSAFEAAIKHGIVGFIGRGLSAESITLALSPGSVVVQASIIPPVGVSMKSLQSSMSSTNALCQILAFRLCSLEGITAVCDGNVSVSVSSVMPSSDPCSGDLDKTLLLGCNSASSIKVLESSTSTSCATAVAAAPAALAVSSVASARSWMGQERSVTPPPRTVTLPPGALDASSPRHAMSSSASSCATTPGRPMLREGTPHATSPRGPAPPSPETCKPAEATRVFVEAPAAQLTPMFASHRPIVSSPSLVSGPPSVPIASVQRSASMPPPGLLHHSLGAHCSPMIPARAEVHVAAVSTPSWPSEAIGSVATFAASPGRLPRSVSASLVPGRSHPQRPIVFGAHPVPAVGTPRLLAAAPAVSSTALGSGVAESNRGGPAVLRSTSASQSPGRVWRSCPASPGPVVSRLTAIGAAALASHANAASMSTVTGRSINSTLLEAAHSSARAPFASPGAGAPFAAGPPQQQRLASSPLLAPRVMSPLVVSRTGSSPMVASRSCLGGAVALPSHLARRECCSLGSGSGPTGTGGQAPMRRPLPMQHLSTAASGPGHVLSVKTSANLWESIVFTNSDDLEECSDTFMESKRLRTALRACIVARMRQMLSNGQLRATLDVTDFL